MFCSLFQQQSSQPGRVSQEVSHDCWIENTP